VVADINGDSFNDVVMGGEDGQLTALSGADGSVLPGFPIQLAARSAAHRPWATSTRRQDRDRARWLGQEHLRVGLRLHVLAGRPAPCRN